MSTPSAREALARLLGASEQAPTGLVIGTDPQWTADWHQAIHQARQALAPEVAIPGEQWHEDERGPMTTPKSLSPAAQAVLDAVLNETAPLSEQRQQRTDAGAALRAAADQVVPEQKPWHRTGLPGSTRHDVRAELLAIATELEGVNG
jgi:hypothetical protein